MTNTNVRSILKSTCKGLLIHDERGREMRFPTRQEYIRQLQKHGLIVDEAEFVASDRMTEAVYLDWLRRPQIGCVFAQLLARPRYRTGVQTVVVRGSSGVGYPSELAIQIDRLVQESVNDASDEALSVLLPQILKIEVLAQLVWELSNLQGWTIERDRSWRGTLVLVGLRVEIATEVFVETLGMGPFSIFPTTRQCPVTTLEIRTKPKGARRSHLFKTHRAAHLAQVRVDHILKPKQIKSRFKKYTPALRNRILGGQKDMRAKAGVTYSIPAAIWNSLKARKS